MPPLGPRDVIGLEIHTAASSGAPSRRRRGSGERVGARAALAVLGPGIIVMAANNDAGSLLVYGQAGAGHGTALLWTLLALLPILVMYQEMAARVGLVTGRGLADLTRRHLGGEWAALAVGVLLAVNWLVLVTEFVGVGAGLEHLGVSRYAGAAAAVALVTALTGARLRTWERSLFAAIGASVLGALALATLTHPNPVAVLSGGVLPSLGPAPGASALVFVLALVGTTLSPWQLFFQAASVVEKRLGPSVLRHERIDTVVGALIGLAVAAAVMVTGAALLRAHSGATTALSPETFLSRLALVAGPRAGALFAVVLVDAAVIGAAVVVVSSARALAELRSPTEGCGRAMTGWVRLAMLGSAAMAALAPGVPRGVVLLAVQGLAGILLPTTVLVVLLLASDVGLMGRWVNPRWLNAVAGSGAALLAVVSLLVMLTAAAPRTATPSVWVAAAVAAAAIGGAAAVVLLPAAGRAPRPRRHGGGSSRATRGPAVLLLAAYGCAAAGLFLTQVVAMAKGG
jgi:Mn2+/Fe2+ NRAMP family transporter